MMATSIRLELQKKYKAAFHHHFLGFFAHTNIKLFFVLIPMCFMMLPQSWMKSLCLKTWSHSRYWLFYVFRRIQAKIAIEFKQSFPDLKISLGKFEVMKTWSQTFCSIPH